MGAALFRILTRRSIQIVLLLVMLGGAVTLRLQDPPAIGRIRQMTFDTYNRLMPRSAHDDVRIVDIDEESLRRLGQWPWPRTLVGELPLILRRMGAKAVVFDMVFSEPDRTSPARIARSLPDTPEMKAAAAALAMLPDNDEVFARKIKEAGNVVTGFVAANEPTAGVPAAKAQYFNTGRGLPDPAGYIEGFRYFTANLPGIAAAAAGDGSFTMTPENDGVVRRVPILLAQREPGRAPSMFPALSLEAVRVATGKDIYKVESFGPAEQHENGIHDIAVGDYKVPTDENGRVWVYYTGHRKQQYVSAWKVLANAVAADMFKDKIVLVGTSAIGLLDLRSSPLNAVLPGVEIHAELIEQVLHGQFLSRPFVFEGAELVVMIVACLCIIFLAPFVGAGTLASVIVGLIMGTGAWSVYVYEHNGWLIAPVYPALTVVTIFIASSILTNLRSEMERRQVRTAFGHYISPALLEELTADPSKLKLGGEVREMSVMFTDIRNFTSISEQMEPGELIRMMNDFLTPMTACAMDNRGTIDKYMGDAMMAFWNAPLFDPDHARNACKSAIEMLDALVGVNAALKARMGDRYRELRAGIGVNTGKCSVGNMGSKQRFAYSALGDTVNLASRLEGQTKGYGVRVLISESTRRAAPEFAAIEIDLLTVKGRSEPERVFTLLGGVQMAQSVAFGDFAGQHARMLAAYRAQSWDEALALGKYCVTAMPELAGLYALYASRIAVYRDNPPAEGWGGIWVASEK